MSDESNRFYLGAIITPTLIGCFVAFISSFIPFTPYPAPQNLISMGIGICGIGLSYFILKSTYPQALLWTLNIQQHAVSPPEEDVIIEAGDHPLQFAVKKQASTPQLADLPLHTAMELLYKHVAMALKLNTNTAMHSFIWEVFQLMNQIIPNIYETYPGTIKQGVLIHLLNSPNEGWQRLVTLLQRDVDTTYTIPFLQQFIAGLKKMEDEIHIDGIEIAMFGEVLKEEEDMNSYIVRNIYSESLTRQDELHFRSWSTFLKKIGLHRTPQYCDNILQSPKGSVVSLNDELFGILNHRTMILEDQSYTFHQVEVFNLHTNCYQHIFVFNDEERDTLFVSEAFQNSSHAPISPSQLMTLDADDEHSFYYERERYDFVLFHYGQHYFGTPTSHQGDDYNIWIFRSSSRHGYLFFTSLDRSFEFSYAQKLVHPSLYFFDNNH